MRFIKEYKSLEAAVLELYCVSPIGESNHCFNCRLSAWNNRDHSGCQEYIQQHPVEVASLLGLEIVSDPDTGGGA